MKKKSRLSVTWFGHSAFLLEFDSGTRIVVDPWLNNPKAPPDAQEMLGKVDAVLVTHGHSDHLGNTVDIAAATGCTVIGIHELSLYLGSRGVAHVIGMNKGGTVEVKDVAVTMVDARHSADIDADGTVVPGGEAAGFVIRPRGGPTVYHAGDTCVFGDMKLIHRLLRPQIVILPIGGLYTMDPEQAALACQMFAPRTVIGMHYGTFPPLSGTPEKLRKLLPAKFRSKVIELTPGIPKAL